MCHFLSLLVPNAETEAVPGAQALAPVFPWDRGPEKSDFFTFLAPSSGPSDSMAEANPHGKESGLPPKGTALFSRTRSLEFPESSA